MLLASPLVKTALLLLLTAFAAALMLVRVNASQKQADAAPSTPVVSLAGHTPGSAARERHAYRLRVAEARTAPAR